MKGRVGRAYWSDDTRAIWPYEPCLALSFEDVGNANHVYSIQQIAVKIDLAPYHAEGCLPLY